MTPVLFLAFAVLLVSALFQIVRGPNLPIRSLSELEQQARPVDLEAFGNLIDPKNIEFLRIHLPKRKLAEIEKERKRVVAQYLKDIAHNCVLLMRIAEAAADNPNAEIQIAAMRLSSAALECRMLALRQMVSLRFSLVFPPPTDRVPQSYSALSGALGRYSLAADPSLTSKIAAAI